MGLGTKIKDALSGDHHDDKTAAASPAYNDNKTPGAFPSDDVSKKHGDAPHGSAVGGHGTTSSATGPSGTQHNKLHKNVNDDLSSTGNSREHGQTGVSGGHVPVSSTTSSSQDPYWGNKDTHTGTSGLGHNNNTTTGYDDPQGVHGPHGSKMANTVDPRVDSDRDHRGAPGSGAHSGTSGLGHNNNTTTTGYNDPQGAHGPHSSRVANAADPRVDSDRDHRGAPHSGQSGAGTGAGAGYLADKSLPERPHHGQESSLGGSTHPQYDHSPQNQAVGGGVYNSVTGAGSEQDPQHRINHPADTRQSHNQSHNPLSSSSGTSGLPGGNHGQRSDGYKSNVPSSRNDHGHSGHGLAGAGAVGAAGIGAGALANKHHNDSSRDNGGNNFSENSPGHNTSSHHTPGVPRSSMLDIEEPGRTGPSSGQTSHLGGQSSQPGGQSSHLGGQTHGFGGESQDGISRGQVHGHGMIPSTGVHGSNQRNEYDSTNPGFGAGHNTGSSGLQNAGREGISRGPGQHHGSGTHNPGSQYDNNNSGSSGFGSSGGQDLRYSHGQDDNAGLRNAGSGLGSATSPTSAGGVGSGGGGLGKEHFGPAHEGAKVMHQCHGCGADNDISHYFKKDAVYRIGS